MENLSVLHVHVKLYIGIRIISAYYTLNCNDISSADEEPTVLASLFNCQQSYCCSKSTL